MEATVSLPLSARANTSSWSFAKQTVVKIVHPFLRKGVIDMSRSTRWLFDPRRVTAVPLFLLFVILLAGCGQSQTSGSESSNTPPATQTPAATPAAPSQEETELEEVIFVLQNDNLAFSPFLIAMEEDYFREEGINLKVPVMEPTAANQALASGNIHFTTAGTSAAIQGTINGANIITVASSVNRLTMDLIVSNEALAKAGVTEDSPIEERLQALKGLRIGTSGAGTSTDAFSRYYLVQAGLDPERDAHIVAGGGGGALVAALQKGQIDAFMLSPPNPQQLVAEGYGTIIISGAKGEVPGLDNFIYDIYTANKAYVESNPETVVKVTKALVRACNLIHDDPATALSVLQKHFDTVDPAIMKDAFESVAPAVPRNCSMDEPAWENTLSIFQQAGLVKEDAELDLTEGGIWTMQFIEEALKS